MEGANAVAAIAVILHALSAVVWVGGMFFAHQALRPAAVVLEPGPRLLLWARVLGRFFAWVIGAVVLLLVSGLAMVSGCCRATGLGRRRAPAWPNPLDRDVKPDPRAHCRRDRRQRPVLGVIGLPESGVMEETLQIERA